MRPIVYAIAVAGLLAATLARAGEVTSEPTPCDVPAYLLSSDSHLDRAAEAIRTQQKLDILVVGTGSSSLPGPEGTLSSYPSRLEASLRDRLQGITVNVASEVRPRQTAEQVAEVMEKLAAERKPALIVWQTGTVDAIRAVSPDDFRSALDDGVSALKASGIDVILLNPQYSPRSEAIMSFAAYLDSIRIVAQQQEVPLFDRFAIMRHWQDVGDFDLSDPTRGLSLAKKVHECLGRALSLMIIEAAGVKPGDFKVQR